MYVAIACTAARSSERKHMLKFAQLQSKTDIFAEIARNYPDTGDMYGSWEIDTFNFKPPKDNWMDAFKPLATFELELKCMPQLYKLDVWISGTTPEGEAKKAKVGTIANRWGLGGAKAAQASGLTPVARRGRSHGRARTNLHRSDPLSAF
jgi:hypothetical protein